MKYASFQLFDAAHGQCESVGPCPSLGGTAHERPEGEWFALAHPP